MDNPIVPFARPILTPALPSVGSIDMYGCLLADAKNPRTLQARIDDIRDLGKFLGVSDPAACVALVIGATRGQGAAVAIGWQKHMLDKGLSGATINRRLSTLRRLCKLAGRLEVIDWAIDADNVKAQTYKDTKGPGHVGWKSILDVATKDAAAGSAKGVRDLAIIRLLHDNGLRRGELVALDLSDVDLDQRRVRISGKGTQGGRQWVTINGPTAEAVAKWTLARGSLAGPLFTRLDRAGGGRSERLTGHGVHDLVRQLGAKAGLARPTRPHALRHEGATRLLELTGGNVRAVQRWTRHADVKTVLTYDDNREDLAGSLVRALGEDV